MCLCDPTEDRLGLVPCFFAQRTRLNTYRTDTNTKWTDQLIQRKLGPAVRLMAEGGGERDLLKAAQICEIEAWPALLSFSPMAPEGSSEMTAPSDKVEEVSVLVRETENSVQLLRLESSVVDFTSLHYCISRASFRSIHLRPPTPLTQHQYVCLALSGFTSPNYPHKVSS
ncbi:hypothetical protein LZ32DRAFT_611277 [Colletotrichum eremochloae]|nr:hypothetical protein LZ32DRAFT_611277 [Colletotrichum eremochloae]